MARYSYQDVNIKKLLKELKEVYPSGVSIKCDSLEDTSCIVNIHDSLRTSQYEIDEIVNNLDLS